MRTAASRSAAVPPATEPADEAPRARLPGELLESPVPRPVAPALPRALWRLLLAVAVVLAGLAVPALVAPTAARAADGLAVTLTESAPASTLVGDAVAVTLTASNATSTPGYNLTLTDVIPAGATFASADAGLGSPSRVVKLADGTTKLIWSNVADLQAGVTVASTYSYTTTAAVGAVVTTSGAAFVSSAARTLPKFDAVGAPVADPAVVSATAGSTTTIVPFRLDKKEDSSPEGELLRGVHDHPTTYTLTVTNNEVGRSTGFSIVDFLPAGLEFLGCTSVDNSAAGTVEYPGAPRLDSRPLPDTAGLCREPASVSTVRVDPDGTAGPLALGVYTRVEWTGLGDLAAGEEKTLRYAAAVPLRENELFPAGAPAAGATGLSTANLDNNTGSETRDEQPLTNSATTSGSWQGTVYTSSATATVSAEDVRIVKTRGVSGDDQGSIRQGATTNWHLAIATSEYAQGTSDLTVVDTIPDGLSYDAGSATHRQSGTAFAPVSTTPGTASPWTQAITWTVPASTAPNGVFTIDFTTTTLGSYRSGVGPVAAEDSWTNRVDLTSTSTLVDARSTPDALRTHVLATPDDSSAGQEAAAVVLTKQVAVPQTTADCTTASWVPEGGAAPSYGPGDTVCWKIEATFPVGLNTVSTTVKDFLPAGFAFVGAAYGAGHTAARPDAVSDGGVISWTLPDEASGNVFQAIVTSTISDPAAAADGDITANLAKLTFTNTAGAVFQLRDQADAVWTEPQLTTAKTATPTTVQGGDTVDYTVTVSNSGRAPATEVSVRDLLPAGWTAGQVSQVTAGGAVTDESPRSRIDWSGLTVPARSGTTNGTLVLTYSVAVPAGVAASDTFDNTAGVRQYQDATNTGTPFTYTPANNVDPALTTTNAARADATSRVRAGVPSVAKTRSVATAPVGSQITYRVTTTIPGGVSLYSSAEGLAPSVTDQLPQGLQVVGVPTASINGGPAAPATVASANRLRQRVSFDLPTNAQGVYVSERGDADVVVLTITATVVDSATDPATVRGTVLANRGVLTWWPRGTSAAPAPASRAATSPQVTTTVVEPALTLAKTDDATAGKVVVGQAVTYSLRVRNPAGTAVSTAHDVVVSDVLPQGLTWVDGGSYDPSSRTITFPEIDVAPGASPADSTFRATVDETVGDTRIRNVATAVGSSLDGAVEGERSYSATAEDTVTGPSLSVVKALGDPAVTNRTTGELTTYTLDVRVPAGVSAYDVTVHDTLPSGQAFGSLTAVSCASCDPSLSASMLGSPSTGTIGFWLGDVTAAAAERVVHLEYTAYAQKSTTSGQVLTNVAQVAFDKTDKIDGKPASRPLAASYDYTSLASTAAVTVVEPRLVLDKRVDGQVGDADTRRAVPGETLTYRVAVTNVGTGPAYDVQVTDAPDTRFTGFTPVEGGAGTVTGAVRSWTIDGPVAPGETRTVVYRLTVPAGLGSADEVAGPELANTADVASYAGVADQPTDGRDHETYHDVDADTVGIEVDLASLAGSTWFDAHGDGVRTAGDPRLSGVGVTVVFAGVDGVLGTADDERHPTTSGPDGSWKVDHLPGGSYRVDVDPATLPAGLVPSYDLDGTASANSAVLTLTEGADRTDASFGWAGSGSIGDLVWADRDGDGRQGAGEPGIGGAEVLVTWAGQDGDLATEDDNVEWERDSDAETGAWSVGALPAGNYSVKVGSLPAGYLLASGPAGVSGLGGRTATSTLVLGAGRQVVDQDTGWRGTGAIGDRVWLDRDGDGVQDDGEQGLVGVQLTVTWAGADGELDTADDAVVPVVTGADGSWLVDHLLPGEHRVTVTGALPEGATSSFDEDGTGDGPAGGDSTTRVVLAAGDAPHLTADFGYEVTSSIGDRVWWDVDGDGVQQPGEPGLRGVGVTVTWLGTDGVIGTADDLVFGALTDDEGDWLVRDLPNGDYTVAVTSGVAPGFVPTHDAAGPADGASRTSLSSERSVDLDQDFGYRGDSTIGDRVWLDRDGDGVPTSDEPGLPGVRVTVTWAGPDGTAGTADDVALPSVLTDASGAWSVGSLPLGSFSVVVDRTTLLPGLSSVHERDADLDLATTVVVARTGTTVDDADLGLRGDSSVGRVVWLDRDRDGVLDDDERGLGGVRVDVLWAGPDGRFDTADDAVFGAVTATDGSYRVDGLPAGSYRVSVDGASVPAGLGLVRDEDASPDGVTTIELPVATAHRTADFAFAGGASLGSSVWLDTDGDGVRSSDEQLVPGQPVSLTWAGPDGVLDTADDQLFSTVTAADGSYLFTLLPDGRYRVSVDGGVALAAVNTGDPDGGAPNVSQVEIAGGASNLVQDFGYRGTNALGDTVFWDRDADGTDSAGDPRLPGVQLELTWLGPDGVAGGGDDVVLTTTTDAAGSWRVDGLPDGRWTVAVVGGVPEGLTPSSDADATGGSDGAGDASADGRSAVELGGGVVDLDQDFGFAGAGSIGDTVWLDEDGDGRQGADEVGIPGVTVTLTWGGVDGVLGSPDDRVETTVTDEQGRWLVEHLAAGEFRVELTGGVPAGLTTTRAGSESGAGAGSGSGPGAGSGSGSVPTSTTTLAAGEADLDQDFGFRADASVGDSVWLDVDGDGVRDPHEPGVGGVVVTVRLAGADGALDTADDLVLTRTTDASGAWTVDGLPAGAVRVSYEPATLPAGTVPASDLDGGTPTATTLQLDAGEQQLDVDFVVRGTASVGGVVFDDADGDGVRDPGEKGVGGVGVTIVWSGPEGPVTIVVTTGPDGSWSVGGLPAGDYTVTVSMDGVPAGTRPSTGVRTTFTLAPGGSEQVLTGLTVQRLAFTGSDLGGVLLMGLSLLAAGGAALVVSRRPSRRRRTVTED
jgi:uncharacterized repeat protein (TIGR01451 family)/fimbrial isopeptide formation D2 family protein